MDDEDKDPRCVGRDEMNLAEFPITLLTDYPPEGVKMLVFEDRHGKLTVVGSEDRGLPTATDSDVIVGLIQLTKLRNDFTDPTVEFSRYELLRLLGWPDQTHYYQRLKESLLRPASGSAMRLGPRGATAAAVPMKRDGRRPANEGQAVCDHPCSTVI